MRKECKVVNELGINFKCQNLHVQVGFQKWDGKKKQKISVHHLK